MTSKIKYGFIHEHTICTREIPYHTSIFHIAGYDDVWINVAYVPLETLAI